MQENLAGVRVVKAFVRNDYEIERFGQANDPVSYTHLRAHETVLDLVCRLLLEKNIQTHSDIRTSL